MPMHIVAHVKGCTSVPQIYRVDPASSIDLATNCLLISFLKVVFCEWRRVVLGGSEGQGYSDFVYTWNEFVFLLYHFLYLISSQESAF